MNHLYPSVVRVERMERTVVNGRESMEWVTATDPDPYINHKYQWLECRLDMNFLRPGKDAPAPVTAGKQPDRIGIMFCDPAPLRAGDRVVAIPNEYGKIVVPGAFDVHQVPDLALDFDSQHHIEVQVIETVNTVDEGWADNDD